MGVLWLERLVDNLTIGRSLRMSITDLPFKNKVPDPPRQREAVVTRTEFAMPRSITLEMAKGFTIYMGEGDHEWPGR